ncbi:MAG: response regulator [bacterium]
MPPSTPPATPASSDLSRLTILLVDDHEDSLQMMTEGLRFFGAAVFATRSAREALGHIVTVKFDVVITDLTMPEHGGHWLLQQTHAIPAGKGLPFIALSAHGADQTEAILAAGFAAHARKPIDPTAMALLVNRLLSSPKT